MAPPCLTGANSWATITPALPFWFSRLRSVHAPTAERLAMPNAVLSTADSHGTRCYSNWRHFLHTFATTTIWLSIWSASFCVHFTAFSAESTNRPNIVLILADDLGYAGLSATG